MNIKFSNSPKYMVACYEETFMANELAKEETKRLNKRYNLHVTRLSNLSHHMYKEQNIKQFI